MKTAAVISLAVSALLAAPVALALGAGFIDRALYRAARARDAAAAADDE